MDFPCVYFSSVHKSVELQACILQIKRVAGTNCPTCFMDNLLISQTNTFQAVLATDNVRSYAIFQYADGLIQWPSSGAQVGFNAGNNVNYVNIPGSRTPYILNIAGNSNVGISGQWIFLISQGTFLGFTLLL